MYKFLSKMFEIVAESQCVSVYIWQKTESNEFHIHLT